jgi:phage tail-like protein
MAIAEGDALSNYGFQFEADGQNIGAFREVSGLNAEVQVIEHKYNVPGGKTHTRKLPGAKKWGDVTLKRGKTADKALWEWMKLVHDGKIEEARRNASVVLYDYSAGETVRWNLLNCWPTKVSVGNMQAGASEILVEEATFCHEGIELA